MVVAHFVAVFLFFFVFFVFISYTIAWIASSGSKGDNCSENTALKKPMETTANRSAGLDYIRSFVRLKIVIVNGKKLETP